MTQRGDEPSRRLTRAEAAAVTREQLLDSGRAVFVEDGYDNSSIYTIAERAGRTIGALYSHFGNKEGLFLALWDRHIGQVLEHYARAVETSRDPGQVAGAGANLWAELLTQDPGMFRLFIEFWAQALREPALKARLVEALRRWRAEVAALVSELAERIGVELPVPPDEVAVAVEALVDGFALHVLADAEQVDAEMLSRALGWLVVGVLSDRPGAGS